MRLTAPAVGAGLATLALAAPAFAHTATVACDRTTGTYVVTADYQQLHPSWTFTDATVVVRWSDGYRVVRPLPMPCEAPPVEQPPVEQPPVGPPPAPQAPPPAVVVPPMPRVIDTPPVVVTPPPARKRPPLLVSTRRITVRTVPCYRTASGRAYRIDRIVVTRTRGGHVVSRTVSSPIRVEGGRCVTAVLA
jgi:hypothetical protein